jgi:Transposase DDE domain
VNKDAYSGLRTWASTVRSRRWCDYKVVKPSDGWSLHSSCLVAARPLCFTPGILNLADRGFFSMHRWIRFSGTGADLAWRVKNSAKSVPLTTLQTLPDGSELVMLHESDGMRARRRKEAGDLRAARLPDTIARLVTFTVTATTRSGRTKTTRMRVLTTLLDHEAHPAREIAALYAERWKIEIAFLHLKKTVRGPRRPLRGQSPEFARQEAWALLLIHNITATASARAAGSAGIDPGLIPFTAVLGLIRSHVAAETPCRHCGHRPASPLASLNTAILALPRHRQGRQRTSGRTAAERRTRHTEEVIYIIDITKSNLPQWTQLRKLKGSGVRPGRLHGSAELGQKP